MKQNVFFYLVLVCAIIIGCTRKEILPPQKNASTTSPAAQKFGDLPTVKYILEDAELGSKGSYALGNVTLKTGVWTFDDALIGTLTTDRKVGAKSFRIRNTGSASMNFNVDSIDVRTIVVYHGVFGSDAPSQWRLYYSSDNGLNWKPIGDTITSSDTVLQQQIYVNPVFTGSKVRFQIKKLSGAGRINIDNFIIGGGITYTPPTPTPVPAGRDDNMAMGNPSSATIDPSDSNNYLMKKDMFTLSYNNLKGEPNWVSWHLSSSWLGTTTRTDAFNPDNTLPMGYYHVNTSDYTGSGFDRGHMCPSADRTFSIAENATTFLMTNFVPQAPDNNQGPWENLESYCRLLTQTGNELYIISGGYGKGGIGSKGIVDSTIAAGKIQVPSNTWKIIIILPNGDNDVNRVDTATRIIAVDMPNTQGIRTEDWGKYRTTVRDIETKTGYNFLSNVPISIQNIIENIVDKGPTM